MIGTCAQNPRTLLSMIQPNANRAMVDNQIEELYNAGVGPLVDVWSFSWFRTLLHTRLGDYGYMDARSQQFVHLGNVFETLGKVHLSTWVFTHLSKRPGCDYVTEELNLDYHWSKHTWRYADMLQIRDS